MRNLLRHFELWQNSGIHFILSWELQLYVNKQVYVHFLELRHFELWQIL